VKIIKAVSETLFGIFSAVVLPAAALLTVAAASPLHAGLTVGSESCVTLNGAAIAMNCSDISIASGGTVNVGSGAIESCQNLTIESGGALISDSGDIQMNGVFTLDGTIDIGNGIVVFTQDCGQTNQTGGSGDHDGDGTVNGDDLDDENDGMPDQWEIDYGLNFLSDDAAEDADDDGFTNLQEYAAGTNPCDPNDHGTRAQPYLYLLLGEN
jgi:hypothetical protein